jgi:hypothetical protein
VQAGEPGQQRFRQDQNIRAPPQGRQRQDHHRQPIIQVSPHLSAAHCLRQIGVGGDNKLHIHGALGYRPRTADVFAFDSGEQFALQRQGHCVNLVQEQRPPCYGFEQPGLGAFGSGKGTDFQAEQCGFQHGLQQGRAVDFQLRDIIRGIDGEAGSISCTGGRTCGKIVADVMRVWSRG